jgi:hypothetical protein
VNVAERQCHENRIIRSPCDRSASLRGSAPAADDVSLDWKKSDAAQLKKSGDHLGVILSKEGREGSFPPKSNASIAGLHVVRVSPESVGMGVGFSVVVEAPFDATRRTVAKLFGKPLAKCDSSDNIRTCELEFGEKRTFMLFAGGKRKDRGDPRRLLLLLRKNKSGAFCPHHATVARSG